MTLREFIAKKGMEVNVENLLSWQSVAVGFINSDGIDDETEFDVFHIFEDSETDELAWLFEEFCAENKFPADTVQSLRIVKSAVEYEELE